jgi:alpha-1,2-mannosyltransferase
VSSPSPSRWDRMLPAACCLWLVLAVAAGVKAYVEPLEHTAYPCFEAGTRCWWQGEDLYEMAVCGHEYRYAPAIAVAMTPLAVLPTWLGGALWYWLNIAVYCWALWALMRWVLPGDWTAGRKAAFLALVFLGSVRMIWAAQSNALIFALVAGGAVAMRRGRWWWAALFLAIPVHVKVWPLAAVLLLMACWPRQLLARFAVALAAVGAIPFLTKPFAWVCQQYAAWFSMLVGPAQVRHVYRDAWTVWELIHGSVDPRAYMVLQLAAAAVVLLLCRRYSRRIERGPGAGRHNVAPPEQSAAASPRPVPFPAVLTFILAMWAAWQLLFGPGTERNTFGLIAPLTAWGLMTALVEKRGRVLMIAAFTLTTLANFGVVERALEEALPAVVAMHPVGVLLFAVWLLTNFPRACATAVPAVPAAEPGSTAHGRDGRGTLAFDGMAGPGGTVAFPAEPA